MGVARRGFDPLSALFESPPVRPGTADADGTGEGAALSVVPEVPPEEMPTVAGGGERILRPEVSDVAATEEIDKVALAKALAQAALSKFPNDEVSEEPEDSDTGDRRLTERAPRPTDALEAARVAAAKEQKARRSAQREWASALPGRVESLLGTMLPGARQVEVVNALIMDDRKVLKALWKAHRTRMSEHGVLGMVVAATSVLRALDRVPQGQLVAAIVATESSEYLVWVDMGSHATIAAFPEARTWVTRT